MRFPSLTDLDREQRRIYAEAPKDGSILVVGPPGTGKTVMAFHRAQKLKDLGQAPHVIMYNRVLRAYTGARGGVAAGIDVSTMNKWVEGWWRRAARSAAPKELGKRYDIDWNQLCADGVVSLANGNDGSRMSWGHLLVDEGQDFPPTMYLTLGILQARLSSKGVTSQVTIFADDNQRLSADRNCRVVDIRKNLFIEGDATRNFTLRKNFRNTREIAMFASYYQVGNESGVAELPDTRGNLPEVVFASSDRDLADFVVRKTRLNPGAQVGVIVHGGKPKVKRTYNQIKSRLEGPGPKLKLQMYVSKDEDHTAERLVFDKSGTITVLHMNSAKGLEFDVVFFVGAETMDISSTGFTNERMALYVMCSRARSELYVVLADLAGGGGLPDAAKLLPAPRLGLCKFVGLGAMSAVMSNITRLLDLNPDLREPRT